MSSGSFDYSGFQALVEGVKNAYRDHRKFIDGFLLDQAKEVLEKAKQRTPAESGTIKDRWRLSGVAWRGNECMINVLNDDENASTLEYGYFLDTEDENGVAGSSWVDGNYMVTIPIQELERALPPKMEVAWRKYMEEKLR